jgi:hypothetical protein
MQTYILPGSLAWNCDGFAISLPSLIMRKLTLAEEGSLKTGYRPSQFCYPFVACAWDSPLTSATHYTRLLQPFHRTLLSCQETHRAGGWDIEHALEQSEGLSCILLVTQQSSEQGRPWWS